MDHEYDERLARIERKIDEIVASHNELRTAMVGPDGGNGIRALVKHHDDILTQYPPRDNHERISRAYWGAGGIAAAVTWILSRLGL